MKSLKSSRRSSSNSRISSERPTQANVFVSNDSYSLPQQLQKNLNENESSSKPINIKPLSKVAKASGKLNFFKSRIKQNENRAKNDEDSLQDALNSFKKQGKSDPSRRETISSCTDERSGPVSRLSGIIKPRKFGETFRVMKSGKESALRPSSESACQKTEDRSLLSNAIPQSESSSLKSDASSQKLRFGGHFSKKPQKGNDEKVENKTNLLPCKQENFISNSADCVPWRLERNRTFVKEDFEASGLPIINKESGLFRTYSEDCCERTYLEDSPSLSSRASSFGILNDSYLLEQTLGGELVKGDAFEDLMNSAEQITKQRLRHNTFVIRDHSKDKVLSLSSLMPVHDSHQKSGTFVTKSTNNVCISSVIDKLEEIVSKDRADETSALRGRDFTPEESKRPISLLSTSSVDVGIVADYGVDYVDQQPVGRVANIRPMSIISTSSVDTGYQPDSDVENCRIPSLAATRPTTTTNNDDNRIVRETSTIASSSDLSSSAPSSLPQMTDPNNNDDNSVVDTSANVTCSFKNDDTLTISLDKESNIRNDATECVQDDGEFNATFTMRGGAMENRNSFLRDDDDDEEDEDDYLILSSGSTLYGAAGLLHGGICMASTPDKKGHIIIPEKDVAGKEGFVCNKSSSVVGCHGDLENESAHENIAKSGDSNDDSTFPSHPMELSCILEADNEVVQPTNDLLNNVVDAPPRSECDDPRRSSEDRDVRATNSTQGSTVAPLDVSKVDSKLTPVLEEADATGVAKSMTPDSPGEADKSSLGGDNLPSENSAIGEITNDMQPDIQPDIQHDIQCDISNIELEVTKDTNGREGQYEVRESSDDATPTGHGEQSVTSSDSSPQCVGISHHPDALCLNDISVEGVCDVVAAGVGDDKIDPRSSFTNLEMEESVGNNAEVSLKKDVEMPEDKNNTFKSSPERKTPPKNNSEKSGAVKKPVDPVQISKSSSNKIVQKSEKIQRSSGSLSNTPRNTSRTSQSSSSTLSKSKLSEPIARRNPMPKKYSAPKLQTNLIGSSTRAQSVNHLVDGQVVGKTPASSNSSSPKVDSKDVSPAGSDGKLVNAVVQAGRKVVQKNIFQSSTDLKSKGLGETTKVPTKPLKKLLPMKRSSVVQEPAKTSASVVRRASVNVPTVSSTKQKASNPLNATANASTNGRQAAKKPVVPPKPTARTNNLDVKAAQDSVNKSFNDLLSCRDNSTELKHDLRMKRVKFDLYRTSRAVEALSVVVKHFEAKADKKNNCLVSATKKLHQASSNLASLKEQLCMVTRQRDGLLVEVQNSDERHKRETKDLKDSMNAERVMMEKEAANNLEAEINKLNKQHADAAAMLRCDHKTELELLAENNKRLLKEKNEKFEEVRMINEQHEKKMRSTSTEHKHQLDDLTFRFEQMKMTLLEKVEVLRSECDDLRHRESTFLESCQREAEVQVQSCLSRYKQLPQEIESLKAVLELRNQEVHELRALNLQQQKEHEELEESQRTNHFLKQKIENLEAIVDMRGDYEKQLTEKYQLLVRKLEKESKMNKRLSMDNEELHWKLTSISQLPSNQSLASHQFPAAMSSSFTSGVTSLDRRLCKGDKRPLSVGEVTKQTPPTTPTSHADATRQGDVFEASQEPATPSFLSFSPPRHQNARPGRVFKGSKTTPATMPCNSRTMPSKIGSSSVCASGDGNKLQRSGTYNLKDMERDVL